MLVPVVHVGVVRMPVRQWLVSVPMAVRFAPRIGGVVSVPVVHVVMMRMLMLDRVVGVGMVVPFGQVKADASRHQ